MRTYLPAMEVKPAPDTKSFPATCAACGAARMLGVPTNQPLVDVKTVAASADAPKPQAPLSGYCGCAYLTCVHAKGKCPELPTVVEKVLAPWLVSLSASSCFEMTFIPA